MAITSGFFDSLNGDRLYNAEAFSTVVGCLIKDGVFPNVESMFQVTHIASMQIKVASGRAWFNNHWLYNDNDYVLTLSDPPISSQQKRKDAVVLRFDLDVETRSCSIVAKEGTPTTEATANPPDLDKGPYRFEYPLAYVNVLGGTTSLQSGAIENKIGTADCPFVSGIVASSDIESFFTTWGQEFDAWFDNIKLQLTDDVVANLESQINEQTSRLDTLTTTTNNSINSINNRLAALETNLNKFSNVVPTSFTGSGITLGFTHSDDHRAQGLSVNIEGITYAIDKRIEYGANNLRTLYLQTVNMKTGALANEWYVTEKMYPDTNAFLYDVTLNYSRNRLYFTLEYVASETTGHQAYKVRVYINSSGTIGVAKILQYGDGYTSVRVMSYGTVAVTGGNLILMRNSSNDTLLTGYNSYTVYGPENYSQFFVYAANGNTSKYDVYKISTTSTGFTTAKLYSSSTNISLINYNYYYNELWFYPGSGSQVITILITASSLVYVSNAAASYFGSTFIFSPKGLLLSKNLFKREYGQLTNLGTLAGTILQPVPDPLTGTESTTRIASVGYTSGASGTVTVHEAGKAIKTYSVSHISTQQGLNGIQYFNPDFFWCYGDKKSYPYALTWKISLS